MRRQTIAAAHASPVLLDRDGSLETAVDLIRQAGSEGVDLVCFPEVFLPGFPYWINLYAPGDLHGLHLRYADQSVDLSGDDPAPVMEAARESGVNVVLGVSERDGHTLYNSQVFIRSDGTMAGRHRKIQPTFAERMLWAQGDGSTLSVHDLGDTRVGGLICYEHMLNLAREALIQQNQEIHCASWPTFAPLKGRGARFDETVEALSRAHALSGQCFVIQAESPITQDMLQVMEEAAGPQDQLAAGGGVSAIFAPSGAKLATSAAGDGNRLVIQEIDLDDIRRAKVLVDSAGHYARPEILGLRHDRTDYRSG